jgi:hypothetical protein
LWGQQQAACDEYFLFFDQGEPFYGYVRNLCESKKAKQDAGLIKRITQTSEINMRRVPAMQLADLYAWAVSHGPDKEKPEWHEKFYKLPRSGEYHDRTTMTHENLIDPELWKSWKIPPRKPTR